MSFVFKGNIMPAVFLQFFFSGIFLSRINVGENVDKLEPSYIAARNLNGAGALKNALVIFKKLNVELLYDPRILLLGISPEELQTYANRKLVQKCS